MSTNSSIHNVHMYICTVCVEFSSFFFLHFFQLLIDCQLVSRLLGGAEKNEEARLVILNPSPTLHPFSKEELTPPPPPPPPNFSYIAQSLKAVVKVTWVTWYVLLTVWLAPETVMNRYDDHYYSELKIAPFFIIL